MLEKSHRECYMRLPASYSPALVIYFLYMVLQIDQSNHIRPWEIEKQVSFTHFTQKNTYINACKTLHISKLTTITVHIYIYI